MQTIKGNYVKFQKFCVSLWKGGETHIAIKRWRLPTGHWFTRIEHGLRTMHGRSNVTSSNTKEKKEFPRKNRSSGFSKAGDRFHVKFTNGLVHGRHNSWNTSSLGPVLLEAVARYLLEDMSPRLMKCFSLRWDRKLVLSIKRKAVRAPKTQAIIFMA